MTLSTRASGLSALLLLCSGFSQDDRVRKNLEALKSDDVAERNRAFEELKKTPLDQLHLLESSLDSKDSEVQTRVREAVTASLCDSLGRRTKRFSAKAVAPRDVMERWAKDGHDPAKIPEGYERIRSTDELKKGGDEYGYLRSQEILVERDAVITEEHVESAEATEDLGIGSRSWTTSFKLTREGAKRFDAAAARLFAQNPNGILALVVDGVILMAPAIRSASFGGQGKISGNRSREDCERTARMLKGKWFELSWRLQADSPSAAGLDEILKLLRETPGFEEAVSVKSGEKECTVRTPYDSSRQNMALLWRLLRQKGYSMRPSK